MAALGNALGDDVMRQRLRDAGHGPNAMRPVLGVEEFNVQPRGCTITGTDGPDRLIGTPGADVICGLGGDDRIERHGRRRRRCTATPATTASSAAPATTPCTATTATTASTAVTAPTS